jgi:hypothetical protein
MLSQPRNELGKQKYNSSQREVSWRSTWGGQSNTNAQTPTAPSCRGRIPGRRHTLRRSSARLERKKNVNGVTRPTFLLGVSLEYKDFPFFTYFFELGETCRKGSARALKNSITKTQWPLLKRVKSATPWSSLRLLALQNLPL